MTAPNLQETLAAVRAKLLASSSFTALVGTDVGTDSTYADAWLFQSSNDDMIPDRNPRNTGKSAVVFDIRAPWTSPNTQNTLSFPLLSFRIVSDSTRGTNKNLLLGADAKFRCDRIASAIKTTFNDVANRDHHWPNGVYIVSCLLWTDLRITDIPDSDSLVEGDLSFALEVG